MVSAIATSLVSEPIAGYAGGCFALWLATKSLCSPRGFAPTDLARLKPAARAYLQGSGLLGSIGLLLLRLSSGVMMFHHDRHHGGYVANLNGLITSNPTLAKVNVEALQGQISRYPCWY